MISIYTSVALVVLMFLFGEVRSLQVVSMPMWGGLMASALIGIAFGHVLYYRGIHRLGQMNSGASAFPGRRSEVEGEAPPT